MAKVEIHWVFNEMARNFLCGVNVQFIIGYVILSLENLDVLAVFFRVLIICLFPRGLLAYVTLHEVIKRTDLKVSPFRLVAIRWLRAAPVMAGSMLMVFSIPTQFGDGPVFREGYSKILNNCYNNWWRELIGFGNINRDATELCLVPGWAISADFQLFICFLPVIYTLHRKPRFGLWILACSILVGISITAYVLYQFDLEPFVDAHETNVVKQYTDTKWLHLSAHNYISSYAMGVLIGHLAINRIVPSAKLARILWLLIYVIFSSVTVVPAIWRVYGRSQFQKILFGSLYRTAYSSGAAWFLYRMITIKSVVSRAMSWQGFAPFGRMFLTMFFGMTFFTFFDNLTIRTPIDWRHYDIITRSTYIIVYGMIIGYIMHIVIEAPFMVMLKTALLQRKSMKAKDK